jgi:hypothetical protein
VIIKYTIKQIKAFAVASSIAQEVLRNIRTVTAFHGQWKEEQRWVPNKHAGIFIFNYESSRLADNLIVAKKVEERKGMYMGICQGLSDIFLFAAFAITFW